MARRQLAGRTLVAICLALVLAGSTGPLVAQEPSEPMLGIEEAVRLALSAHWSLEAAEAAVDVARADLDRVRSQRLPRLDVSAGYTRTTNPVGVFGTLLRQERFGPENFDIGFLNEPDALGNWSAGLQVRQPVWTGGRIARAGDAAFLAVEAERAGVERTRQEVAHGAIRAWADAVLARYQVQVAREVLETARAHVELVRDLREGGLALDSDVLQARLRVSEVEEMLVRAESAVEVSTAALNVALGRPSDAAVRVPDTLPEPAGEDPARPVTSPDGRGEERPDLAAAGLRLEAALAGVEQARSERMPEVGLVGAVEANDPDFFGLEGTNWTLGAMARWTVFDGGERRARELQARARARQARAMRDLLAHGIDVEIQAARSERRAAGTRLEQARTAIAMATESLRTVEDRYREGMVTLVELLDAQTMLTRSRARELAARRDLVVAQADLDLATGTLDTADPPTTGERR